MSDAPNGSAVVARGLTKRYGDLTAVDDIGFTVDAGECVGFLGPNGAGKTTTVRMLTCVTPLSAGKATVLGLDVEARPREIKARIGVCAQENSLDPDFTVRKNLTVYARYFGIPAGEASRRADALLDLIQLRERANAKIVELSGGMQRRLVLARALVNEPEILVLDEPTTGLDPQARQLIWQRVRRLTSSGTTVLLTTHYMEEASQLCDRVILMHGGRILLDGPPAELVLREAGREVVELWEVDEEVRAYVESLGAVIEASEERIFVYDLAGTGHGESIGRRFPHQHRLIRPASLEDVFLRRAGRTLAE